MYITFTRRRPAKRLEPHLQSSGSTRNMLSELVKSSTTAVGCGPMNVVESCWGVYSGMGQILHVRPEESMPTVKYYMQIGFT
jgi:hypothetical protein